MSVARPTTELSEDDIANKWPLHWLVWNKDSRALNRLLEQKVYDKEAHDPRGRTPLHLAVTLKHSECAEVLLYHGANALEVNRHQWSVLHEAISTGDSQLCGMVLALRDQQQLNANAREIPIMLEKLQSAPDFYIEMKWEFTSWVPFLSRMCPSDTYKIWKKGTKVRVDTSLIGFQNFQWLRGNQSFIFQVTPEGANFSEINHDKQSVWEHPFRTDDSHLDPIQRIINHELSVARRLRSPIVSTIFNSQGVSFQRQKSGIWGFRSDRVDDVNGYKAKVFSVTGLDIVTRTRVDHLPDDEKEKQKNASISPLQDFLGMSEEMSETSAPGGGMLPGGTAVSEGNDKTTPQLSLTEYFTLPSDSKKYDAIGSIVEVHSRSQGLKSSVWLSEEYPLSLQDQILPIVELMSLNNAHFAKLKDFITLQMPSGFPVKFEIPLFHVMAARVTFGNVNGHTQPVPFVSLKTEEISEPSVFETTPSSNNSGFYGDSSVKRRHTSSESDSGSPADRPSLATPSIERDLRTKEICIISDEAFRIPAGYRSYNQWGGGLAAQEEELLQLAIRQSLIDQGLPTDVGQDEEVSLVEALNDQTIMDAREGTNRGSYSIPTVAFGPPPVHDDDQGDFALAIALSQAQAEEDARLSREEEEQLEMVLKLSLQEK